jgi:hypothetical protein
MFTARRGSRLLESDLTLQEAIRYQLSAHRRAEFTVRFLTKVYDAVTREAQAPARMEFAVYAAFPSRRSVLSASCLSQ